MTVDTTTSIDRVVEFAINNRACREARLWIATQSDPAIAWAACERADWMIWYAKRRNIDRKVLVRIACDCARTALRFVPEGENRPRLAIETTERWLIGEATIGEVRSARNAAADAYADAADAAAAAAADAAAAAAAAADADAVADAAYVAAADAYADARKQANIKMCNIIRMYIPYQDIEII